MEIQLTLVNSRITPQVGLQDMQPLPY